MCIRDRDKLGPATIGLLLILDQIQSSAVPCPMPKTGCGNLPHPVLKLLIEDTYSVIMSAKVWPEGIIGNTCSWYGTIISSR